METSALSGKNVARLIANKWASEKKHTPSSQDESASHALPNPDAHAQVPLLPPPEADAGAPQLEVGGEGVTLDHLGPLVVNKDGSLSRIANWEAMSERERANTLRVLKKRNQLRLGELEGGGIPQRSSSQSYKACV